jgi:putative sigma-54 modulation protein
MKFIVVGRNLEVTDALKTRVIKKLGKVEKFFNPDTEAHVTMSLQKNRQILEVTIPFNGIVLRAEEKSDDMYAAIDRVVDVLERQIMRNKTRLGKRIREDYFTSESYRPEDDITEEEFHIVRSKKFAMKPMVVEEAILQMNLLGHEFFVFMNGDTKKVNVVYRRKDGNYGLIEPEF